MFLNTDEIITTTFNDTWNALEEHVGIIHDDNINEKFIGVVLCRESVGVMTRYTNAHGNRYISISLGNCNSFVFSDAAISDTRVFINLSTNDIDLTEINSILNKMEYRYAAHSGYINDEEYSKLLKFVLNYIAPKDSEEEVPVNVEEKKDRKWVKTCIAAVTVCAVAVTGLIFYDRFR